MAEDVKELLVRVSATTELLRSQLVSAERDLVKFTSTAERSGAQVENTFQRVGASAGAQRAGMQQLSYQIGDVATQFALGARPMQIFAAQGQQVIQAVALMGGGTSRFAAFMGGPWGVAIMAATSVLGVFVPKLLEGDAALKAAEFSSYGLKDAQGILASVMDMTTGRINTQNKALIALANAQLLAARVQSQARAAEARSAIQSMQDKQFSIGGGMGGGFSITSGMPIEGQVSKQVLAGTVSGRDAVNKLELLRQRGRITNQQFLDQSAAIANYGVEQENVKLFDKAFADLQAGRASATFREAPRKKTGGGAKKKPKKAEPGPFDGAGAEAMAVLYQADARVTAELEKMWNASGDQAIETARNVVKFEFEERQAMLERLRAVEAKQIDFLSGLFENAFRGGTKAIWSDFKDMGLAVISQLLARFAMAKIGGGGFDFGSALGATVTGVLGFANGGRPPVGRVSMVGERGPELFIPDVAGSIVPNHALGGTTMAVTINAPGATAETVSMIRRELANAFPAMAAAASAQTMRGMTRRRLP